MKKITNELKVGLMVVIALLILGGLIFKIGDFDFAKKGYHIKVMFNFVGGVTKNAPVRLAGVEVGKVEEIKLAYGEETKVSMTLWLDSDVKLRADSMANISSLGLMGEKYIEINPGSKDAPFLEPGSTIVGEDPFQIEFLTKKSEAIVENLDKAIKDINLLANNVNEMIIENREEIDNIMVNLETTSANLKELSADIKRHPWKVITKPPGWKKMIQEKKQ